MTCSIVREDGVGGLFRGAGPTVVRAMSLNMGMLASNDQVRLVLREVHDVGCRSLHVKVNLWEAVTLPASGLPWGHGSCHAVSSCVGRSLRLMSEWVALFCTCLNARWEHFTGRAVASPFEQGICVCSSQAREMIEAAGFEKGGSVAVLGSATIAGFIASAFRCVPGGNRVHVRRPLPGQTRHVIRVPYLSAAPTGLLSRVPVQRQSWRAIITCPQSFLHSPQPAVRLHQDPHAEDDPQPRRHHAVQGPH